MKSIKFRYLLVIVALAAGTPSCKKYFDVNTNPNLASTSSPDLLLTTAQLFVGNAIGDRLYEQTSVWSQYYTGGPGVSLGDWDKNTMATSDGNQVFRDLYRSMSNLSYIATKTNEPYYQAVAKILIAYNTQVCADLFGDVPYTDALKGDIADGFIIAPKYDDAETVVYPGLEASVKEAIHLLDSVNASLKAPAGDDLIFPSDGTHPDEWAVHWKKFANSLLLKMYVRQGDGVKFAELYNSGAEFITSNDDNAFIAYPGEAQTSQNPWFTDASSTSLGNYFVGSKTTIDYLVTTQDPRIDYFYDPPTATTPHNGLKQGDVENSPASAKYSVPSGALTLNGVIFYPTAPVILVSAWEVNLILAEGAARGWIADPAKGFYDAAVQANSEYLGVPQADIDAYLAGGGAFDAGNALKSIALQKWVSFNGLQPVESWIETRRNDNPTTPIFTSPGGLFVPPTNNVLGGNTFPSILYYPATEQDLNSNFPKQHVLTDRVFWDN